MLLSERKNVDAINFVADMLEPISKLLADSEVQLILKLQIPTTLKISKILRRQPETALEIFAILDGADPETYEISALQIPMKIIEIGNDPELAQLFTSLGQREARQ